MIRRRPGPVAPLFLLLAVGCSSPESVPRDGIAVVSSRPLPIARSNPDLDAACRAGEDWVGDPVRIARWLAGDPQGTSFRVIGAPDAGEDAATAAVTLLAEDLKDDSLGAHWLRVRLRRADCGWRLIDAQEAFRCRRSDDPDVYRAGPCP